MVVGLNNDSKRMGAKGELVEEDPGKASDLIHRFNSGPQVDKATDKKERKEGTKISEDRLKFLTKKSDDTSPTVGVQRGVRPGGGDSKWLKKLEEEEAARKDAAASRDHTDDAVSRLQKELQQAGIECTERSRLLTEVREKYQILTKQLNDLQELLGLANSARIQLANNGRRVQKEIESEAERKSRELVEKEALKRQAIEMRDKLNELVASDQKRVQLQGELDSLRTQFELREQEALAELNRLTEVVKELTTKMESRDIEWEKTELRMHELQKQLDLDSVELKERDTVIDSLKIQLESVVSEHINLKTDYESVSSSNETLSSKLIIAEANLVQHKKELSEISESWGCTKKSAEEAQSQITSLECNNQELKRLLEAKEKEFSHQLLVSKDETSQLQERYVSATEEVASLKTSLTEERTHVTNLTEELTELKHELSLKSELVDQLNKANVDLVDTLKVRDQSLSDIRATMAQLKSDILTIENEKQASLNEISLKEEALIALKAEMEDIKMLFEYEKQKANSAEATLTEVRAEAASIQREILVTTREVEAYQQREKTWQTEKAEAEAKHLSLANEVEKSKIDLEFNKKSYLGDVEVLQGKITVLESELSAARLELEATTRESILDSEQRIEELNQLKKQCNELNDNLVQEQVSKDELTHRNNELTKQHEEELEREKTRFQEKVTALSSQLEDRGVELNQQSNELFEMRKLNKNQEEELVKQKLLATELTEQIKQLKEEHTESMKLKMEELNDKHQLEVVKLDQEHAEALEIALNEFLLSERERVRIGLQSTSQINTEINVCRVGQGDMNDITELNKALSLPPPVSGIDTDESDGNKEDSTNRGPSLQSYVETLNHYREKMIERDQKFLKRLNKVRDLEKSLRRREIHVNDRIEKVKTKESHLFHVVKTMKEREAELRSVSLSFEKFRTRLQNSCYDGAMNEELNRTLESPDADERKHFDVPSKEVASSSDETLTSFSGLKDENKPFK